jgi:hypothetical protein
MRGAKSRYSARLLLLAKIPVFSRLIRTQKRHIFVLIFSYIAPEELMELSKNNAFPININNSKSEVFSAGITAL